MGCGDKHSIMNTTVTAETSAGPRPGPSAAVGSLALALLVAVAWGLVTARVQFAYAPWLLFPLIGGLILGGLLALVRRGVGWPSTRRGAIAVTVLACLIAVPAQHVFCYWQDVAEVTSEEQRLAIAASPELARDTFWHYLRSEATLGRQLPFGFVARGAAAWASHGLDAALVVVGAVLITLRNSGTSLKSATSDSEPSNEQTTA